LTTSPRSSALIGSDPDKDAVEALSLVGGAQLLAGLSLLAGAVDESFFPEADGEGMTRKVALLLLVISLWVRLLSAFSNHCA
jgi:hypothetical protein